MPMTSDGTFIMLFLSTAVFCIFCSTPMEGRTARLIGRMSPYMLGIYLVHCHPSLGKYIWVNTLPVSWLSPQWLTCPLNILVSAAVIFVVCMAIDLVRKRLFDMLCIPRYKDRMAEHLHMLNK